MKIGFLIAQISNVNGTERALAAVANGLSKKGYDVGIITCKGEPESFFPLESGIQIFSLHNEKIRNPVLRKLSGYRELWYYARKARFDVLVAVDIYLYPYLLPLQLSGHCRTIAWEHFQYYIDSMKGASLSRKLAVHFADKVVVLGKRDMENYRTHFRHADNVTYIYNPVAFTLTENSNIAVHRIIAAGRLTKQKGFDLLLDAWRLIEPEDTQDWTLDIFGEGEERPALEEQIRRYGLTHVHLCGYSKELDAEMERSSIFVLSSRFEGFVLVLLEAQAKGLPCVSFDCKEGPAEIIDDGVNGFLVPEGNVEALAAKLSELMKNKPLRESFSRQSHKDLECFQPDVVIAQWEKLLESL